MWRKCGDGVETHRSLFRPRLIRRADAVVLNRPPPVSIGAGRAGADLFASDLVECGDDLPHQAALVARDRLIAKSFAASVKDAHHQPSVVSITPVSQQSQRSGHGSTSGAQRKPGSSSRRIAVRPL
jgi:hypothetical protein